MQRLIYLVLALAVAGGSTYLLLKNVAVANRGAPNQERSAPREQIDRMQNVGKRIEQETQKRIDDLAKKSE
jgi:hypothetical protein